MTIDEYWTRALYRPSDLFDSPDLQRARNEERREKGQRPEEGAPNHPNTLPEMLAYSRDSMLKLYEPKGANRLRRERKLAHKAARVARSKMF